MLKDYRAIIFSCCKECPLIIKPTVGENICIKLNKIIQDDTRIDKKCPYPKLEEEISQIRKDYFTKKIGEGLN